MQFASVQSNVERDHKFTLTPTYSLATLQVDGRQAYPSDAVGVFLDPLLRMPAPDSVVIDQGGPLLVLPNTEPVVGRDVHESVVNLSVGDQWGFSDRYYIAEYLDAAGARLPTPTVTAFTVPTDVPATSVAFAADSQGVGHFSWDPVKDATRYYIVSLTKTPADGAIPARSDVLLMGDTKETSWTTIEQDGDVQKSLADAVDNPYASGVLRQNKTFPTYLRAEDAQHGDGGVTAADVPKEVAYGVIAKTPAGLSPIALLAEDLTGTLPVVPASNAASAMGTDGKDVHTAAQLPTKMPVTMSDGRTVLLPMHYAVDAMIATEMTLGTRDDSGKVTKTGTDERYRVTYTVAGTLFTGGYTLDEPDMATAQAGVRTVIAQVQAESVKAGAGEAYTYQNASTAFDPQNVSTTAPAVPYPVNGTNPLTTYLAANLIAGKEYIDLSAYLTPGSRTTTSGISLHDAFTEALDQNPFILRQVSMTYDNPTQIMGVGYRGYATPEDRVAEQERLADEVAAVTAAIVTPEMAEPDKVRAINTYLTSSADYDYVALDANDLTAIDDYPNAWTATGVLLDKKGVCASYAKAFLALADAAGLESVYVTGTADASGERHAWSKVRVDGVWRVVDVTWNDSAAPDQYLLLTDAQTDGSRTQDAAWIVDSRAGDYAAN